MVNSSPEYAITKPGMGPHARKRDKPLRTYGRRSASTPESRDVAPPAKKRRLQEVDSQTEWAKRRAEEAEARPAAQATPSTGRSEGLFTPSTAGESTNRASILSYFKPVRSNSSPASSNPTNEPLQRAPSPTSPPVARARKRARVLRFRAAPQLSGGCSEADGLGDGDDQAESEEFDIQEEKEEEEVLPREQRRIDSDPRGGSEHKPVDRDPLQDRGEHLHNQRHVSPESIKSRKTTKRRPTQTVQTTLNMSSQAAFSECKVCDTVYNPLYPDDVKYHSKRHAAVLRASKRAIDEQL